MEVQRHCTAIWFGCVAISCSVWVTTAKKLRYFYASTERVFFKSDTSDTLEAVATTSDGKIDYGELSNTFGLEPYSIRLCGDVFPKDKDLLTKSSWTEIKNLLRVPGTKEDPVLVAGNPRPVAPTGMCSFAAWSLDLSSGASRNPPMHHVLSAV